MIAKAILLSLGTLVVTKVFVRRRQRKSSDIETNENRDFADIASSEPASDEPRGLTEHAPEIPRQLQKGSYLVSSLRKEGISYADATRGRVSESDSMPGESTFSEVSYKPKPVLVNIIVENDSDIKTKIQVHEISRPLKRKNSLRKITRSLKKGIKRTFSGTSST